MKLMTHAAAASTCNADFFPIGIEACQSCQFVTCISDDLSLGTLLLTDVARLRLWSFHLAPYILNQDRFHPNSADAFLELV